MKTKSFVTLLAVAVILGSIIGGALAGGIAIGKSQGKSEARQELQSQTGGYSSLPSGQGNVTTGQGNVQLPGNYTGIPSGIDTWSWNPRLDAEIPSKFTSDFPRFSEKTHMHPKRECHPQEVL